MVLRCVLVSRFLTEIWDRICWHQKSWHFLSHFQSENGNNGYRCSETEVFPRLVQKNFLGVHNVRTNRARVFCRMRIAESCPGVICGKSSAERSTNYPLSLFRIPQPKNSAFPRTTKLPFVRIAQQMYNRCIPSRGPLKNQKNKNGLLDIAAQCWIVHQTKH